jgi:hypothetical protein
MKTYTPKNSQAKSRGIIIARAIAAGDVDRARREVRVYGWPGRTIPEVRAIVGACRYANSTYGANLNHHDFL